MQHPYDECLGLFDVLGQNQRAQCRRHGERRDQAAGERISISLRHRPEDVPLDAAEREQRNEARNDDTGGEEDRAIYVRRRVEDREPLAVQAGRRQRPHSFGRCLPIAVAAEPTEYALDHDDGCIDDQPEVDGAHGEKIRPLAADHQDAHGKKQRERNRHADDDGAAQIAEK